MSVDNTDNQQFNSELKGIPVQISFNDPVVSTEDLLKLGFLAANNVITTKSINISPWDHFIRSLPAQHLIYAKARIGAKRVVRFEILNDVAIDQAQYEEIESNFNNSSKSGEGRPFTSMYARMLTHRTMWYYILIAHWSYDGVHHYCAQSFTGRPINGKASYENKKLVYLSSYRSSDDHNFNISDALVKEGLKLIGTDMLKALTYFGLASHFNAAYFLPFPGPDSKFLNYTWPRCERRHAPEVMRDVLTTFYGNTLPNYILNSVESKLTKVDDRDFIAFDIVANCGKNDDSLLIPFRDITITPMYLSNVSRPLQRLGRISSEMINEFAPTWGNFEDTINGVKAVITSPLPNYDYFKEGVKITLSNGFRYLMNSWYNIMANQGLSNYCNELDRAEETKKLFNSWTIVCARQNKESPWVMGIVKVPLNSSTGSAFYDFKEYDSLDETYTIHFEEYKDFVNWADKYNPGVVEYRIRHVEIGNALREKRLAREAEERKKLNEEKQKARIQAALAADPKIRTHAPRQEKKRVETVVPEGKDALDLLIEGEEMPTQASQTEEAWDQVEQSKPKLVPPKKKALKPASEPAPKKITSHAPRQEKKRKAETVVPQAKTVHDILDEFLAEDNPSTDVAEISPIHIN